jgi:NTE family protein
MVFEGGGARGMVFVGAMQVFEQLGHTYKRLLGTSAGAITAALLAAGYTAQEMLEALGEKENERSVFSSFLGQPGPFEKAQVLKSATLQFFEEVNIPLIPDFLEKNLDEAILKLLAADPKLAYSYSFLEYGGLYSASKFLTWMQRRLDSGMVHGKPRRYSGMTLQEFFAETGQDLTLIASDTTGGAMLVLNHRTAPEVPLVWAVRMSMSIPLLWQEVVWLPEWGSYRTRDLAGHTIVDGGLLSNFPIELFVSQDAYVKNLIGPEAGERVLGMFLDDSLPVAGTQTVSKPESSVPFSRAPLFQRITNLMNTTLGARDKLVSENFEQFVVRLPCRGYGITEFELTDERRNLLVSAGSDAMKAYFDHLDLATASVSFGLEEDSTASQADRVARRVLER